MKLNFEILANYLLPSMLRKPVIGAWLSALTTPLDRLYSDFQSWQSDIRLQAAVTCQVMYMEAVINFRLLGTFERVIFITDGDGINVDFIVNVPDGIEFNAQLLVSLLEKYKLKGKRYSVGQSAITYAVSWTDMICETPEFTFANVWTNMVCEQVNMCRITSVSDESVGQTWLESEFAVASQLSVVIKCFFTNGQTKNYTLVIPEGATVSGKISPQIGDPSPVFMTAVIQSITPPSDADYEYIF